MNKTTCFSKEQIILGVDPGSIITGYAVIVKKDSAIIALDYGCIRPPKKELLSSRYHTIFKGLLHLLRTHQATHMAIETPFVSKNPQSALKLGGALGLAIVAAKECDAQVYGYSPREVKRGITGSGDATKENVVRCLKTFIPSYQTLQEYDASDALSIAIFHAHTLRMLHRQMIQEL